MYIFVCFVVLRIIFKENFVLFSMFIQCFDCVFIYDGQMERTVKYTELQDRISLQTVLTEQGTYEESKTQLENAV